MMRILKQISAAPSPEADQLETQIYHAFGMSGNLTVEGKTLERILLDVLEKRGVRQWWDLFQKNPLKDSSIGAICDALGKIGTKDSIKMLSKLGKSREGSWIPRAKDALKRIGERTSLSKL